MDFYSISNLVTVMNNNKWEVDGQVLLIQFIIDNMPNFNEASCILKMVNELYNFQSMEKFNDFFFNIVSLLPDMISRNIFCIFVDQSEFQGISIQISFQLPSQFIFII